MFVAGLRNVWPIHSQWRFKIYWSSGFYLVHCHSSLLLLLMVSVQRILSILSRQFLIKVWTLLLVASVVVHIFAPYKKIALTLLLNSLILVLGERSLDAQTFLS